MSDPITVITIRPTALRGQRIEPGTSLSLSALDAHALVTNGKARLRHVGDAPAVNAAAAHADYCAVRAAVDFIPSVQTPWQ